MKRPELNYLTPCTEYARVFYTLATGDFIFEVRLVTHTVPTFANHRYSLRMDELINLRQLRA